MSEDLEIQKALAAHLLDMIAQDLSASLVLLGESPASMAANTCLHGIRRIIGVSIACLPAGPERQAMKAQLAGLLGDPFGQLLTGMDPREAIKALEAHGSHMAIAMGPQFEATGRHPLSTPDATKAPHLKVVS